MTRTDPGGSNEIVRKDGIREVNHGPVTVPESLTVLHTSIWTRCRHSLLLAIT